MRNGTVVGKAGRWGGGYTLVELVVVLAIFCAVLAITAISFDRIVSSSGQIIRSSESNIEGIIGLEVLRFDLENAGFGLPWSIDAPSGWYGYAEADPGDEPLAATFNDAPAAPPRGVVAQDGAGFNGSDYLVLKGTSMGTNRTARKWSFLSYSSGTVLVKPTRFAETELALGPIQTKDGPKVDRVILLKTGVARGGEVTRELNLSGTSAAATFSVNFTPTALASVLTPVNVFTGLQNASYLVYGLDQVPDSSNVPALRMPFNRADFYLARPKSGLSRRCAPQTGVLYKGKLNQKLDTDPVTGQNKNAGTLVAQPLLDCVADMQVIFSLDTTGDGGLYHADPAEMPGSAAELRDQVKEIRVYLLAQEGRVDRSFVFPSATVRVGEFGKGRDFPLDRTIGPGWQHYRWKLYTIVVQPKNLN